MCVCVCVCVCMCVVVKYMTILDRSFIIDLKTPAKEPPMSINFENGVFIGTPSMVYELRHGQM